VYDIRYHRIFICSVKCRPRIYKFIWSILFCDVYIILVVSNMIFWSIPLSIFSNRPRERFPMSSCHVRYIVPICHPFRYCVLCHCDWYQMNGASLSLYRSI
jgi:hypothetical protein